jgi:hypothetical protein
MKKSPKEPGLNEISLTIAEFLETYNKNMPVNYPRASLALLQKFKASNESLFKSGDKWSLDQHRKRLIDWLPQNIS